MNPFENKKIADEWTFAIENNRAGVAREADIYPRISEWLQAFSSGNILDIGCGQGDISGRISQNLAYIGVDSSQPLIDRAQQIHSRPNTTFFLGNAYKIPQPDSLFIAAFSVGVWFHLQDLYKASVELNRVLTSDGKFYIITANPNLNNVWESFFQKQGEYNKTGKRLEGKTGTENWQLSNNVFYLHSMLEIEDSLNDNGLKITAIEKFGYRNENTKEGLWMGIQGYKYN